MSWPDRTNFSDAIQNPWLSFKGTDLEGGTVLFDRGVPQVFSGASAFVYPVSVGNRTFAVRCFISKVRDQQAHYAALSEYLLNSLPPSFVDFEYVERGIMVKGVWYPVVKMDWVDGELLSKFVESRRYEPATLRRIAALWRGGPPANLRGLGIAHNDLQHGNVMVKQDGSIRLVDYDGMFLPRFRGERSPELGHENYQHPHRTSEHYDENVDNFPSLVIYLSLLAIASDPSLCEDFHNEENLILTKDDFADPGSSEVFYRLKKSPDLIVAKLAERLEECCALPVEKVPDLEAILADVSPSRTTHTTATGLITPTRSSPSTTFAQAYRQTLQALQFVSSRSRATFDGLPLPSDSRSAWAVLLLIVVGISLISWGISSLFNFLDSDPFGRPPLPSGPPGEGTAPMPPRPPDTVPVPARAGAVPPLTETPTPTVVASPTPTPIPSPAPVQISATPQPEPTQAPLAAAPLALGATPMLLPTPTHAPILVKPDLTLDTQSFYWEPKDHSIGDVVTFTIKVVNAGGPAGPSSLAHSIFSVGLDTNMVSHGVVDVPAMQAHESVEVSFEWLPGVGNHVFEFEVDPEGRVDESNETDNLFTSDNAVLYPGPLLADLVVESIAWSPDAPAMGESVTFQVTIRNKGEGRAGASMVELYVDNDLLAEVELLSILPGESKNVSFRWDAQVGAYPLRALTDSGQTVSETDEGNNKLVKAYQATTFVDLVVEEVNWEPSNPSVGDEVTLTVTVMNQGTLDAGESSVELSLIPLDGAASSSETQMPGIPAGEVATATFHWRAQSGDVALSAYADIHGTVVERDEANNVMEATYSATLLPDLIVTAISWEPNSPALGEEVTIAVQLENRGNGSSLATDVTLYVNDTGHGEAVALPGLSSMDSHTASLTWTAGIGTHAFRAHVDQGARVVETNETNNWSETFEYNDTRVADLRVRSVDWQPESPLVGDTVMFEVTIKNRGDAPARDFRVSFRDTSSVWPALEKMVSGEVGPGQSSTVNFEWHADADPHQFEVVTDSRAEVIESNEDNNVRTVDYAATVATDLVFTRIVSTPRSPSVDEDTTIKATIKNEGPGRAGAFTVTLNISGSDGVLDKVNRRVDGLATGASKTLEFPWKARAGTHTFTAAADSRGVIAETDESNNILERTVVTALPDLTVTEVQFDSLNPTAGDDVVVGARIENVGRGKSGRFTVRLYVVGEDKPQESVRIRPLEPDTSASVEFTWRAAEGCHELLVIVDANDNVPEENEGNNRTRKFEVCAGASQ